MNFLLVAFGWSILLTEVTLARPNSFNSKQSVQNKRGKKKGTGSLPAENKCNIVVNGDYYAGGPNKEIKTILQGLQAQLSEMQEQLREIKTGEGNKTGKKKGIFIILILFRLFNFKLIFATRSNNVKTTTKYAVVFIIVDAFTFTLEISENTNVASTTVMQKCFVLERLIFLSV